MKIGLILIGITFLVLSLILTIIGLILWMVSKSKKPAAVASNQPAPYQPAAYPPPYPPPPPEPQYIPPPPEPYIPPPPTAAPPAYTPMPTPPMQPMPTPAPQPMPFEPAPFGASEEKTVLVPTSQLGAALGALACTGGPLAGRTFPVDPNGFYVGRDRNASQVVIEDTRISKRHLWIGVKNGEVVASDQGSTNGTYLNAPGTDRIAEVALKPGDVLILADDVARFEYQK